MSRARSAKDYVRFATLSVGLASAAFLFITFSDVMLIDYPEAEAFSKASSLSLLVSGTLSLAFFALSKSIQRRAVRIGMIAVALCFLLWWYAINAVFEGYRGGIPEQYFVFLCFTLTIGRLCGFVNLVQWTVYVSSSGPFEMVRIASASFLVTLIYFFAGGLSGSSTAVVLAAGLVCALLGLFAEYVMDNSGWTEGWENRRRVSDGVGTPEGGERFRAVKKTRIQYLLSRIAWGIVIGVFVGISMTIDIVASTHYYNFLMAFSATAVLLVGVSLLTVDKAMALYLVVAVPLLAVLLAVFSIGWMTFGTIVRLMAMLAAMVWSIMLCVQLPTNNDVVGLERPLLILFDRVIPFFILCVVAWSVRHFSDALTVDLDAEAFVQVMLGTLLFCLALASVTGVLIHVANYYPAHAGASSDSAEPVAAKQAVIERVMRSYGLTPREVEVCFYLSQGYSKAYVAKKLYVSAYTVKAHARSIYRKMGVGSQDALIEGVRDLLCG